MSNGTGDSTGPIPTPGNVLVVDDSQLVRLVISRYLKDAGHHVEQAEDGTKALDLLATGRHDVVITDIGMPGLDGFEVLAAAKRLAPGVEVIILTGEHSQDMQASIRALRMGAHDYLAKPPQSADEVNFTVERALEKKRLRDTNERLVKQLETLSLSDALTGVMNRRAFDEALVRAVASAARREETFGLIVLDIDHFKSVNDTYGHGGGDGVLRWFAATVTGVLRKEESLYRCGGEEFAVILADTNPAGVLAAGNRIVARVAAAPVSLGETAVRVTTSAGGACFEPGTELAELGKRADRALYRAKREGRNQMCFDPPPPPLP